MTATKVVNTSKLLLQRPHRHRPPPHHRHRYHHHHHHHHHVCCQFMFTFFGDLPALFFAGNHKYTKHHVNVVAVTVAR